MIVFILQFFIVEVIAIKMRDENVFENIEIAQAKERKAKDAKRPKFRDFTNINGKKAKRKKEAINKHVTLKYIMDTL